MLGGRFATCRAIVKSMLSRFIPVSQGGRKARYLEAVLGTLVPHSGTRMLAMGDTRLEFDLSVPSQRRHSILMHNVRRDAMNTGLYAAMKDIHGGVFLDIGAYLGTFSFLARELNFQSIAFEPDPDQYAFLKANKRYLKEVHNVALSDQEGAGVFYRGDTNPGANSVIPEPEAKRYDGTIETRLVRLDSFDISGVTLIKIDVEGHEAAVVRGMGKILESKPPIWCEVRGPNDDRSPNSDEAVTNLLGDYGYKPHVFDRAFRPARVEDSRGLRNLMYF